MAEIRDALGEPVHAPLSLRIDVYRPLSPEKLDRLKTAVDYLFGDGVGEWRDDDDDMTRKLLDAQERKIAQISLSDDWNG